jgi:uncharacterized protein (TIGR02246 family)
MDKESDRAQQAYRAYVKAWKLKDIPAFEETISDDYMAVNFRGRVSDKKNEIATAKEDAEWTSMIVDEIHTRIFGNTAIASGCISAQGKTKDGNIISTRVRFLAALIERDGIWQLVATQSTSFKPVPAS